MSKFSREQLALAKLAAKKAVNWIREHYHPDMNRPEMNFGQLGEPWQYKNFIEPFFNPRIDRIMCECPRDWDKTGLFGACIAAECLFNRGIFCRSYATDREQAGIVIDSIDRRILRRHPELQKEELIIKERGKLKFAGGSVFQDEASDARSAIGKPADRVFVDELHCWDRPSDVELWNSFVTKGRTKIVVATNPGARRSGLCWDTREDWRQALAEGAGNIFFFTASDDPWMPSWLNEDEVRARSRVPAAVFRRFHLCLWGEGGDAFTEEEIVSCMRGDLRYADAAGDLPVVFGLDFGYKRNWTAIAGCAGGVTGVTKVHKKIWKGSEGSPVQIADIENYVGVLNKNFNMRRLALERPEMISTIQRLKEVYGGGVIEEWVPSEKNVIEISQNIYQLVSGGRFWFPASDKEFADEMRSAELAPASGRAGTDKTNYKIRFRDRGRGGHGDDFRATAIAAYYCTQGSALTWADIRDIVSTDSAVSNFGGVGVGANRGGDGDDVGPNLDVSGGDRFWDFSGVAGRERDEYEYDDGGNYDGSME